MPAFVTHALFGAEVYAASPVWMQAEAARERAAYEWGLQGPDLLFYNGALSPFADRTLNWLGSEMHRIRTGELFDAMCSYARSRRAGRPAEIVRAYLLGFCCHYALDASTHPYIFWRQRCLEQVFPRHRGIHNRVESDLDTDYFYYKARKRISEYRLEPDLLDDAAVRTEIAKLYQAVLWTVYRRLVDLDAVLACFASAHRVVPLLLGRSAPLLAGRMADCVLLGKAGLGAHVRRKTVRSDVLNLRRMRWKALTPGAHASDRSFLDLTAAALDQALELQGKVLDRLRTGGSGFSEEMLPFDNGRPD